MTIAPRLHRIVAAQPLGQLLVECVKTGAKRSCLIDAGVADFNGPRDGMSIKKNDSGERKATRWAARLMESVRAVVAEHPEADPDNVRHTLILLEQPPLERLRKSLTRGRALAQRK